MKIIIEFILTFLIIWTIYYFFIIKRCKKNKGYVPAEVNLILSLHQIDYKRINLISMTKVVSILTSLILSVIITLISNYFENKIIILIFGALVSVLVAIICYNYVGMYYKKKSMEKKKHK